MILGDAQIERYSRQIILPEVGGRGQQALLESRVLLACDGPIGETAALYLAAAGIGELTLIGEGAVCRSLAAALRELNPEVNVRQAAEPIAAAPHVLIDAAGDDQLLRSLNRAAVERQTPLVVAREHPATTDDRADRSDRPDGSIAVFEPHLAGQACALCEPLRGAGAGPAGPLATLLGSLAALQAIQLRLGLGDPRRGRRLVCRLDGPTFTEFPVERRPGCEGCAGGRP